MNLSSTFFKSMSLGENLPPVLHSNLIYILARVKALRKWRSVMEMLTDITGTLMEFLDSSIIIFV